MGEVPKKKVDRGSVYIVKIYSMKKSSCKIRQSVPFVTRISIIGVIIIIIIVVVIIIIITLPNRTATECN